MGSVELRERFFGGGVVGTVDLPRAPTLSWSEHRALLESASDLRQVRGALGRLGLDVVSIARAIDGLEGNLGLRLDQQAVLLDRQVHLLADIAQSLRTPARVRAAERLSSVGELLRRKRYDRALAAAVQAVEDDPNNPAGFIAAGWAHIGLENLGSARTMFSEAAEASDGDARSTRVRQVARLTLALDGAQAALDRLNQDPDCAQTSIERGAVAYDRCVYLSQLGDEAAAVASLSEAGRDEPSFLFAALADPLLVSHRRVVEEVSRELDIRQTALDERIAECDGLARRLAGRVAQLEDAAQGIHASGRDERRRVLGELAAIAHRCDESREDLSARARSVLQAELLSPVLCELQDALSRAETFEAEVLGRALQASELERAVLSFADREDAWPRKLSDGTWEITKSRRFGSSTAWRAFVGSGGEPIIEADAS